MADSEPVDDPREEHRLGTINRWDPPEGDWAAEYDWTRYRGPDPWPVPGGWVFRDPEGGGWWQYLGDLGVGHDDENSIRDALEEDDLEYEEIDERLEEYRGPYAFLSTETANPDEVSIRDYSNEKLEWSLKVGDTQVFRRVEPDRSDMMGVVAEALAAFHEDELEEKLDGLVPSTGRKPDDVLEQEALEQRKEENQGLDEFAEGQQS